jgi:hypothetical protein
LLNSVFFVIEALSYKFMESTIIKENSNIFTSYVLFVMKIIFGAVYILVLIGVNLIGYAVGVSGIKIIINKLLTKSGAYVLLICFYFLCWGVYAMLQIEEYKLLSNRKKIPEEENEIENKKNL